MVVNLELKDKPRNVVDIDEFQPAISWDLTTFGAIGKIRMGTINETNALAPRRWFLLRRNHFPRTFVGILQTTPNKKNATYDHFRIESLYFYVHISFYFSCGLLNLLGLPVCLASKTGESALVSSLSWPRAQLRRDRRQRRAKPWRPRDRRSDGRSREAFGNVTIFIEFVGSSLVF